MFYPSVFLFKQFTANYDHQSVVKYDLIPPIITRIIRIYALEWYLYIALRLELYGCKASKNIQCLISNMAHFYCTKS